MSTSITAPSLRHDDALVEHLRPMLGTAVRRQLWLVFLDEDHRPVGPVLPTDDYPTDPSTSVTVDDLGTLTAAGLYGARFAQIMRELDLARVVLVWERRGGQLLDAATREWACAFGDALRERGASVRAQLLLHDRGVRVIPPDDLV